MLEPGPLLASGRDADIFEYGTAQVLRRSRDARTMEREARTMQFVYDHGYPSPRVDEVSADGTELVMERISGVNMLESLTAAPWKAKTFGRVLGDLHGELHELTCPDWLEAAPCGTGTKLLHLDLHPLNVMMSSRGPIVIDWSNAARGDPNVDVALTWTLMSSGDVPTSGVIAMIEGLVRTRLIRGFVGRFDRDAVLGEVEAVVRWKSADPHMSAKEIASMHEFVRRVQA